jgi:hypothetical protein
MKLTYSPPLKGGDSSFSPAIAGVARLTSLSPTVDAPTAQILLLGVFIPAIN